MPSKGASIPAVFTPAVTRKALIILLAFLTAEHSLKWEYFALWDSLERENDHPTESSRHDLGNMRHRDAENLGRIDQGGLT